MPSTPLISTIALLVLALSRTAHADPKQEAQAHIAKATEAHGQENYALAITELEAAYALDPVPDLLFALGQVSVLLDRCPQAIGYYERYLATRPPAQAVADTRQAIATCKGSAGGQAAALGDPASTGSGGVATTPPPPLEVRSTRSPWYKDRLGDALVATGVVAGVIGVVMYRGAVSSLDDAEAAPDIDRYRELVDDASSKRTVSVVMIASGGALIGAGIVRYLLRPGARETARVVLSPTPSGGVVTYSGSF